MRRLLRILLSALTGRDELWHLTSLVKHQPAPSRRQIRAALWRRNRRSSAYWLGGLTLFVIPLAEIWLSVRLGPFNPGALKSSLLLGAALGGAAVLPGIVLLRIVVRRNLAVVLRESQVCTWCGYDLRATPDRCPECGTPAAAG